MGAGGPIPSWREHLESVHRKRVLERQIQLYGQKLKAVNLKIRAAEKKVATAQKKVSQPPQGILANLHLLADRREELKLEIRRFKQELVDIETMLIASQRLKDYDEDEEDIEALLLS